MNSVPQIFKEKVIRKRLDRFTRADVPGFDAKFKEIGLWVNASQEKYLDRTKEVEIQGTFMTRVFNQVFGYSEGVDNGTCYNQKREFKSSLDTSEADAALGFFYKDSDESDVRVVVELKDARTPLDKKQNRNNHLTPVEQAFTYANKNGSRCTWVIVSNFVETRLYRSSSSLEYETFDMRLMKDEKEFLRFYYFLAKEHLISETGKSDIDQLYIENEEEGQDISNQFYLDYKDIRQRLFISLKEHNPSVEELTIFEKSQKIMDRFIFICFCEDCDLLPQNVFQNIIESSKNTISFSQTRLWDQLRGLFRCIDKGYPPMKINQYNGGLFREDPVLDGLFVPDEALEQFTRLSSYDFNSDLNVNILGQIFEQSISDVEQIKAEISGEEIESKKRKDDGIFYTPYYVTRYIVEQTVGRYLEGKKQELKRTLFRNGPVVIKKRKASTNRDNEFKFTRWEELSENDADLDEDAQLRTAALEDLHCMYWEAYEDVLRKIRICDPSCGSGAFLNQCFDFLHEEIDFVHDMKQHLHSGQATLFDIDKSILQNNLYGVDLNPESVEITKLSLWLKTARKNQMLTSLDGNIRCGNSIIADPEVDSRAFDWEKEFADIFADGGFDIIVGNPPYGARLGDKEKLYLSEHYVTTEYNYDTYKTFYEKGFSILKEGGFLGYITPNTFFTLQLGGKKLRKFLFSNTLHRIVEVFNVFPSAVVEPVITVFQKKMSMNDSFISICLPRKVQLSSTFLNEGKENHFKQIDLIQDEDLIFNYRSSKEDISICDKMKTLPRLDKFFNVMTGAKPYQVGKGIPPQTKETVKDKPFTGEECLGEEWKPYLRGRLISRYTNQWSGSKEYIRYGEWLAEPRDAVVFNGEKLFVRQTGDTLVATYDLGNVSNNTLHSVYARKDNTDVSLYHLLGLLNSTLLNWFYQIEHYLEVGKPMAEVKGIFIKQLPIATTGESLDEDVKVLLSLCQKRFDTANGFTDYMKQVYEPRKITEIMDKFYRLSFKEYCKELKKQKVKLSASQQMDLLPLFNDRVQQIGILTRKIKTAQERLDDKVFHLYGIDEETATRIKNTFTVEL